MDNQNLIEAVKEAIKDLCFNCGAHLEPETLEEDAEKVLEKILPIIEFEIKQGRLEL